MVHLVRFPRIVVVKPCACDEISSIVDELGLGKKILIFCDVGLVDIGKKIQRNLENKYEVSMATPSSIDINNIEQLGDLIRQYDFAVAVGGGRTIDIAKYAAHLMKKPWISFPTILSHDGIVSSQASVEDCGKRISVKASEPVAIIADLDIIRQAPYRYIAAGAGDCIAKISAIEDWKIAARAGKEKYDEVIGEMCLLAVRSIFKHAEEIRSRSDQGLEVLFWSLLCCGFAMNIYGSSRPASGSEHNWSHALDAMGSRALHGEQVAFGTLIMTYLQGGDWKLVKSVMKTIGLPLTASELGITPEMAAEAFMMARDIRDRYTVLNEKEITTSYAKQILSEIGII